jgi:hypothetical protein
MKQLFLLKKHNFIMQLVAACAVVLAVLAVSFAQITSVKADGEAPKGDCSEKNLGCITTKASTASLALKNLTTPEVSVAQVAPKPTANGNGRIVTYSVETRGTITANIDEFKTQANQTLNDTARGWSRMNIGFKEVDTGGEFTLFLVEAGQMTSFSPTICDNIYSCQFGRYVLINQDRWLYATESWNKAGGNLRDYRHMVINHETGHWLGHGHLNCGGPGQAAPVMQQQSMDLQGCTFNPWPLDKELWSSKLGI